MPKQKIKPKQKLREKRYRLFFDKNSGKFYYILKGQRVYVDKQQAPKAMVEKYKHKQKVKRQRQGRAPTTKAQQQQKDQYMLEWAREVQQLLSKQQIEKSKEIENKQKDKLEQIILRRAQYQNTYENLQKALEQNPEDENLQQEVKTAKQNIDRYNEKYKKTFDIIQAQLTYQQNIEQALKEKRFPSQIQAPENQSTQLSNLYGDRPQTMRIQEKDFGEQQQQQQQESYEQFLLDLGQRNEKLMQDVDQLQQSFAEKKMSQEEEYQRRVNLIMEENKNRQKQEEAEKQKKNEQTKALSSLKKSHSQRYRVSAPIRDQKWYEENLQLPTIKETYQKMKKRRSSARKAGLKEHEKVAQEQLDMIKRIGENKGVALETQDERQMLKRELGPMADLILNETQEVIVPVPSPAQQNLPQKQQSAIQKAIQQVIRQEPELNLANQQEEEEEERKGEGKGKLQEGYGLSAQQVLQMIVAQTEDIDDYDLFYIYNDQQVIRPKKDQVIILFLKNDHFTCATYSKWKDEITYFDPLSMRKRYEQDFPQLQKMALYVSPQFEVKMKRNMNAWQETGNLKDDKSYCGLYCVIYLWNYICLDEPFKIASDWHLDDKHRAQQLLLDKQQFPFI